MNLELVPVPLLPGLDAKSHHLVTHDMLDAFLWLPQPERKAVVIDPTQCRFQKVLFHDIDQRYYQYTLVYMDQVMSPKCLNCHYP